MSKSSSIEPVVDSPVELEQAVESPAEQSKTRMNWFALIIALIVLAGVVVGAMAMTGYWNSAGRTEATLRVNVPRQNFYAEPNERPDPEAVKWFRDKVVEKLKSRMLINMAISELGVGVFNNIDDKRAWLEGRLYVEEKGDADITVGLRGIVNPAEDKLILNTLVADLNKVIDSDDRHRRKVRLDILETRRKNLERDLKTLQNELKVLSVGAVGMGEVGTRNPHALQVCRDGMTFLSNERLRIQLALAGAKARVELAKKSPGSDGKAAEEIASLSAQLLFIETRLTELGGQEEAILARQVEASMINEKLRPLYTELEKNKAEWSRLTISTDNRVELVDEPIVHHGPS
jgi:hypothetical protein